MKRVFYFTTAFALGFGILTALSMQTGIFRIDHIPVEIVESQEEDVALTESYAPKDFQARIQDTVSRFENVKIWEINLGSLRSLIYQDEWVKSVKIVRMLPNQIKISVTPKVPLMLLVSSSGKLFPVTEDGTLLSRVEASLVPDLPILKGDLFVQDVSRRGKVLDVLRQLPKDGPLAVKNIAEVTYSADEGYAFLLMSPKSNVKMGEDRIALKAARVSQVIEYLQKNKMRSRVIDASFSKKVLVRLRKDS